METLDGLEAPQGPQETTTELVEKRFNLVHSNVPVIRSKRKAKTSKRSNRHNMGGNKRGGQDKENLRPYPKADLRRSK